MRHLLPIQVPHKESQPTQPIQLLSGRALRALPGSLDSRSKAWREASEHEADHGEAHARGRLAGVSLVIACQPTTAADPCERSFHDPAFWKDDEAVTVAAAHDLDFPGTGAGDGGFHLLPLIARIADDTLDEWKAPSRLPQQRLGAVAVLDARRMNADGEQQAEGVGQDVALAATHLLASVIAVRVERSPPLTAPFAL